MAKRMAKRIALVGDSTLDNCVWVQKGESVPEQLKELLPDAEIINLAADGFTSGDVLHGADPRISWSQRRKIGDPFPTVDREIFRPLEHLRQLSPPPTHIVLSCGGNDVREILGNMQYLSSRLAGLQTNFQRIISKLLEICPNVMVMFIYRPCRNQDRSGYGVYAAMATLPGPGRGEEKLDRLLASVQQQFVPLLAQHRLTVLDLANSFDPRDSSLFQMQIEPSRAGGQIIASLIVEGLREGGPRLIVTEPMGPGYQYRVEPVPVEDQASARTQAVETLKEMGFHQSEAELELVLDQVGDSLEAAISLLQDLV